jgi:hypothetical protein
LDTRAALGSHRSKLADVDRVRVDHLTAFKHKNSRCEIGNIHILELIVDVKENFPCVGRPREKKQRAKNTEGFAQTRLGKRH